MKKVSFVRNEKKYVGFLKQGDEFRIAIRATEAPPETLRKVGFSSNVEIGETLVPGKNFGKHSLFNAEGKSIPEKDKPKETAYSTIYWEWEQWAGRYTETQGKFVDRPYQRYPRIKIPPPSIDFSILESEHGERYVSGPVFKMGETEGELIAHTINLFVEIFGKFSITSIRLKELLPTQIRRLHWKLLPQGQNPWEAAKDDIEKILTGLKDQARLFIKERFEAIRQASPDFIAIGQEGFHGYVVFGFPGREEFILESAYLGNATYVFGRNWEDLSRMTKAQVIQGDLAKERIIHNSGWFKNISRFLR